MDKLTYTQDELDDVVRRYAPKSEDIEVAIERMDTRLTEAEELLEEAEFNVWVECACEPKKPGWWYGDQWELRPYSIRAEERTQRCTFHAQYDAFLDGKDDSQTKFDHGIPK